MKKKIIFISCMLLVSLSSLNVAAQKNSTKDAAATIKENDLKSDDFTKEMKESNKMIESPVLKVENGKVYQFRNRADFDFRIFKPVEIKNNLNIDTFIEKDEFTKPSVELVPETKKGSDKKQ